MIMPIVVVLPAPLPPSRPTTVPALTAKEIASTAVVAPKRLTSRRASMAGVGDKRSLGAEGRAVLDGGGRLVIASGGGLLPLGHTHARIDLRRRDVWRVNTTVT